MLHFPFLKKAATEQGRENIISKSLYIKKINKKNKSLCIILLKC